jgi:type VI secretion system protein ImpL
MIWRLLIFELVAVIVVVGVWFGAPLAGITSVGWRLVIILALLLPPIGLIIWKLMSERRAARGLEAGIREQARAQHERARPDRRQEVEVLREAFGEAVAALKKSRIGGGGGALYALPWYMIIGPPGAGKSTALLHSGLKFPFTTGARKAIKGVGGTRNCDWWFSDQAILLDTAGRYASEDDDQEEWIAFLRLLKRYRRRRPLNGLIVAVSIAEVMRCSPEEIEETAGKLRGRIDQVIEELDLALPVYLLFTKCDLVSGFVQFFGDLGKSARSQVLGFTVPLTGPGTDIEKLFRTELDLLLARLRQRALWRLAGAKSGQRREVYQFPLQLAAGVDALASFATQLLHPNPYMESPRLRGVYFCSGTQEGRPFDTVMAMMSRGLGLKELASQTFEQSFQKKSYFLRDVFTEVMFPDAPLAGSTAGSLSRRHKLSLAALGASVLVSAGLLAPAVVSFGNNRQLGQEIAEVAKRSRVTTPEDPRRVLDGLQALEKLGARLDLLERYKKEGPPWSLGLGFYQGNKLHGPAERIYIKRMRQAFVLPAGTELEATLIDIAQTTDVKTASAAAATDFDLLKAYLMVTDRSRLEADFAAPILVGQWKKRLHPEVAQHQDLLMINARRYLRLVKQGKARWLDRDKDAVANVRHALRGREAEYRALVGDVEGQLRPFGLRDALRGRVQTVVTASAEVPGIYTRAAWSQHIQARLARQMVGGSRIDPWVLGDEQSQGGVVERLRERYYEQYIIAWMRFLQGLKVEEPASAADALRILEKLTEQPPILQELLGAVAYNTELPLVDSQQQKLGEALIRNTKLGKGLQKARQLGIDKMAPRLPQNRVEQTFQPLRELVAAGTGADGRPQIAGITQYQAQLETVREELAKQLKGGGAGGAPGGAADGSALERVLDEAQRVTKGVLAGLPGDLRRLVSPLLLTPLEVTGTTAREHRSGQQSSDLSNELCAQFNEQMAGRYPFARGGKDEAHFQDVAAFFAPRGSVWRYYEERLKADLIRRGDHFEPAPGRTVNKSIVTLFDQAWRVTRALYALGSDTPQIRFQVRPYPAVPQPGKSLQVGEITLEVEGKAMTYRNGPPEQWSFAWTGQDKRSRLLVRGAGGLVEEISFQGDWSLLRLLDRGRVQKRGSWFNVEWPLRGGALRVPMDFRPERSMNPLFMPWRLTCR